jgi:DNA-binding protein HU-beta
MGKIELINNIAKKMNVSKAEAERFMDAYMESVKEALLKEEEVKLIGFGTFSVQQKAATTARNPKNPKETIEVPAKKVVKFKLSKKLKDLFNEK